MQTTTTKAFHFTISATVSQISPPDFFFFFEISSISHESLFADLWALVNNDPRGIDHPNEIIQFLSSRQIFCTINFLTFGLLQLSIDWNI